MRPVDPYTAGRFAAEAPGLCTCWRIIRRDGVEIGLTDHDRDISFTGTTFSAMAGAEGSALEATAGLATDNADIVGVLQTDHVGGEALEAGLFDGAEVQMWRVDWEDPEARLLLRSGTLGEVTRTGDQYRAEFRSLKHKLDQVTGRTYGRTCDAALGDARCGIDLSGPDYRAAGMVADGDIRHLTISTGASVAVGHYTGGTFKVTAGEYAGVVRMIREHGAGGEGESISLWEALPDVLPAGTEVELTAGCDKRFETCRDRFANQLNFRGFPFIPGNDVLMVVARPGDGT